MPFLKIWTDKQIKKYEYPPLFNAHERKYFLTLPASLRAKRNTFRSLSNQIGFHLTFGYFLASKRFYPVDRFHKNDIQFVIRRMGVLDLAYNAQTYQGSTYKRHRELILAHFAFKAFSSKQHIPIIKDVIAEQIRSYEDTRLILEFILDWLEDHHIERPTYYTLQGIITKSSRERDKKLTRQFWQLISVPQKKILHELLENQENGNPVLTTLDKLSPSERPKRITENLEKLHQVWVIFSQLAPVLDRLKLNERAIRFFGELVIRSKYFQVQRRNEPDKYLLLTVFIAYQLRKFEDWMMDTFFAVSKTFFNKAARSYKDQFFFNRKQHRRDLHHMAHLALDQGHILEEIRKIVLGSNDRVSDEQKIGQIFQILRPLEETDFDKQKQEVKQIQENQPLEDHYQMNQYLVEQSQALQLRASPIIKQLHFHSETSTKALISAIDHFKSQDGNITKNAPYDFLSEQDQTSLWNQEGKFQVSLYKMFLFREIAQAVKRGNLNLKWSYKYQTFDQYLVPLQTWKRYKNELLKQAGLFYLKNTHHRIGEYKKMIDHHFHKTNQSILQKENLYFSPTKKGTFHIDTPKTV